LNVFVLNLLENCTGMLKKYLYVTWRFYSWIDSYGVVVKTIPTYVITKLLQSYSLPQYSNKDQSVVCVNIKISQKEQPFIVASVYMPINEIPLSKELEQLVRYCNAKSLSLIIAADPHHFWWGSKHWNQRGFFRTEYFATTDLEVANQGVQYKKSVIDVTLVSRSMLHEIYNWHVVSDDSFSDDRKISFTIIKDKRPSY